MEIKVISRFEKGANTSFHVQSGHGPGALHFVVSFFKSETPRVMDWGSEYLYSASLFKSDSSGKVQDWSPFSSWPTNNADNIEAEHAVRRHLKDNEE